MIYRKLQILELGTETCRLSSGRFRTRKRNQVLLVRDELRNTMLQRNPHPARHRARRPRTAVVLGRLLLAGISLATALSLANAYFNR